MDLLCPFISGRCNGRVNDGYSTMSDGIFDGIFPIVHRTFLLSYFRRCWLLDFSCSQTMWTYNKAAIELAAAVFGKRLQEYQAMSFVTKLRGTQQEYSSKLLKQSIVKRILVFKR